MNRFFVGIFLSTSTWDLGCRAATVLAVTDVPSNLVDYKFYATNSISDVVVNSEQFLADSSAYGSYRTIISETSTLFVALDQYLNGGSPYSLNLCLLNVSASANTLSAILSANCLTYGFFNQNLVFYFFMIARLYQSQQVLFLYDPDPQTFELYQTDLLQQLIVQANLLNIPYETSALGSVPPTAISANTAIYIICTAAKLESTYVTPQFLKSIPASTFVMMGDISENLHDIFGTVPAFVAIPSPLDFTTTSSRVFLQTGAPSIYEIYPMYQIMYSCAVMTTFAGFFSTPFSLQVYLDSNTFQSIPPPWLYASGFSQEKKGPFYGLFTTVFTKNSLFSSQKAMQAYEAYYVSGSPSLPDSVSIFGRGGYTGFYPSVFWYDQNTAWYISNACGVLTVARNSQDTTVAAVANNTYQWMQNENAQVQFIFQCNADNFFLYLDVARDRCSRYVVNLVMSTPTVSLTLPSIVS